MGPDGSGTHSVSCRTARNSGASHEIALVPSLAAPHYNSVKEIREFIAPTVHAQSSCTGTSPCGFLKAQHVCNPNCASGCYCPECQNLDQNQCVINNCKTSTSASDVWR